MRHFIFISVLSIFSITSSAQSWVNVGDNGVGSTVNALIGNATNDTLYVGGNFTTAGGETANYIAKWTNGSWSPLATGMGNQVNSLMIYKGELYAGGQFATAGGSSITGIAKWNGTTWLALGTGLSGIGIRVNAMVVYNNKLYVGGKFQTAGGITVNNIATWDGTNWAALGTGTNNIVNALTVYNNNVYVGGEFTSVNTSTTANYIAELTTGGTWAAMGTGVDNKVFALTSFNTDLIIGGEFVMANTTTTANGIVAYKAGTWNTLGSGFNSGAFIYSLAVKNSTELYAGGSFTSAGGTADTSIAKWNTISWSAVDGGMHASSTVKALTIFNSELYAGGTFTKAGSITAKNIARLCNGTPPMADFTATSTTVCAGQSITFDDLSSGNPTSWSWTLIGADTLTSTLQEPSVLYDTSGIYSVSLVVENTCGNSTITKPNYIVINPLPAIPKITVNDSILTSSSPTGNQWYREGVALTGEVSKTLLWTNYSSGRYRVEVTNEYGCTSLSNLVTLTSTNINEDNIVISLTSYPNPNNGVFTIDATLIKSDERIEVTLTDFSGKTVIKYEEKLNGNKYRKQIETKELSEGIYLLAIKTTTGVTYQKIIRQ